MKFVMRGAQTHVTNPIADLIRPCGAHVETSNTFGLSIPVNAPPVVGAWPNKSIRTKVYCPTSVNYCGFNVKW